MPLPIVEQLHFARHEFRRAVEGVNDADGAQRLLPMNSIGWNVGHLAAQEQRYFLTFAQGLKPYPGVEQAYSYGSPPSTPPLGDMLRAWEAVTQAVDPWLDRLAPERLVEHVSGRGPAVVWGSLLYRVIYHYWYHTGENLAVRQLLGHQDLPEFVGDLDELAPFRPA